MSARLSRRYGAACYYPPLLGLSPRTKLELARLTESRHTEFEHLPERYQHLILEAEANMRRHIAAIEAGDPHALDDLVRQDLERGLRSVESEPVEPIDSAPAMVKAAER